MNTLKTFSALAILFTGLILAWGCKKKSTEPAATGPVPTVSTVDYSNLLVNTVDFTGNVTGDGGSIVTKRGFCWSNTHQNPTIQNDMMAFGNGVGSFSGTLKGLKGQTTYYVCAFATNSNGTGYGNIKSIATLDTTITDVDNNHYRIVQIGTQVWMAENLKTTKFKHGTSIPLITDNTAWCNLSTSGYCWYNNDEPNYKNTYGALYNWYAVNTGSLAPTGWHVPSDIDWTVLTDFLGSEDVAGGRLKETGTTHWLSPNTGATNETGFTALPGGVRDPDYDGIFLGMGSYGFWWSSSENTPGYSWARVLIWNSSSILRDGGLDEVSGFSVRCIRN